MTERAQHGEAPIHVVPYDAAWPTLFLEEEARLRSELAAWLAGPIEHVGSTAIPGLIAKPVIDIMAGVESLEASRGAIAAASRLDYVYFPYRPDVMHWLCKPSPAFRTHHLHLVPIDSRLWIERVAFRDYLRADAGAAAEYAALKLKLAKQFEFDREAYTDAKTPFIQQIIALALPHS
jgi:GrpB-like predicted nucleotidyltransferase (UPF0157 family)